MSSEDASSLSPNQSPVNKKQPVQQKIYQKQPKSKLKIISQPDQKVTLFDVFTFETMMRDLVTDAITPIQISAEEDRNRIVSTHLTIQDLQKRIAELEQFAQIKPQLEPLQKSQKTVKYATSISSPDKQTSQPSALQRQSSMKVQKHWTRFDEMDKKFVEIRQEIKEFNHDCVSNFQNSETSMNNFKAYIDTVRQDFQSRISWAEEANQRYSQLIKDFQNYKDLLNDNIQTNLSQQDYKIGALLENYVRTNEITARHEKKIEGNEQEIDALNLHKKELQEIVLQQNIKMLNLEDEKLSIQEFKVYEQELKKVVTDERERRLKLKRNLLTLENYTERYIPLIIVQTIQDMFQRVLIDKQLKQFNKQCDNLHVNLSLAITEDQGKGSIFANIDKINDYLSKRLFAKINLTKKNQQDQSSASDMKTQMEEVAKQLIKKQEQKAKMKMEADKLLLSSVEQIEDKIREKFNRAQKDLDDRIFIICQDQLRQKDDLYSKVNKGQATINQWQKEHEVEGNILKFEIMSMKDTQYAFQKLSSQFSEMQRKTDQNQRLIQHLLKFVPSTSQNASSNIKTYDTLLINLDSFAEQQEAQDESKTSIKQNEADEKTRCQSIGTAGLLQQNFNFLPLQKNKDPTVRVRSVLDQKRSKRPEKTLTFHNSVHHKRLIEFTDSILSSGAPHDTNDYINSSEKITNALKNQCANFRSTSRTPLTLTKRVTIESVLQNSADFSQKKIGNVFYKPIERLQIRGTSQ